MRALAGRLHHAAVDTVKRLVICTTIGCDPDWPEQIMLGLPYPPCRHCRRSIH